MKKHICSHCQKEFTARRQSEKGKPYCSVKCQNLGRRKRIEKTCKHCNEVFEVHPSRLKRSKVEFCSRQCYLESRHTTLTCIVCHKTVKVRKHIVDSGKYTGQFCSYECSAVWQKGENHSNWNGGHQKWRGSNWIKQKNKARKRDKYTCQSCGITEDEINRPMDVHHIKPWRDFNGNWKKANNLKNLISYCPSCHTSIERNH